MHSGLIGINKKVTFQNFEDKFKYTDAEIIKVGPKYVIGQDYYLYQRENSYTATILSLDAVLIRVDTKQFLSQFKHAIPDLQKTFDEQMNYFDDRIKAH